MIFEIFLSVCILLGAFFAFIAGLGILRLPDVLIRMHASTKAGTLASGLIMLPVALGIGDAPTVARVVAIVVFLLLTAPVGAHMIGRAAFRSGVPLWRTEVDDTAYAKLNARRPEGDRPAATPEAGAAPPP
jgi:multicomponent Na+:H+ antiporter subunit G